MAGELGSDDRLEYASGPTSEEVALSRLQLRKIRTLLKMMRPSQSRTHALSGQASLTLASRKARSSAW